MDSKFGIFGGIEYWGERAFLLFNKAGCPSALAVSAHAFGGHHPLVRQNITADAGYEAARRIIADGIDIDKGPQLVVFL